MNKCVLFTVISYSDSSKLTFLVGSCIHQKSLPFREVAVMMASTTAFSLPLRSFTYYEVYRSRMNWKYVEISSQYHTISHQSHPGMSDHPRRPSISALSDNFGAENREERRTSEEKMLIIFVQIQQHIKFAALRLSEESK
jgi:hypothetical protein